MEPKEEQEMSLSAAPPRVKNDRLSVDKAAHG
jgi:hypothetical protein